MSRRPPRVNDGWPPTPRGPEAWLALPEIPLGRYVLADVGWVSSGRERAIHAGVLGLPEPPEGTDNGVVALPAVTVVGDDGRLRMYRLPLCYAAAVRGLTLADLHTRREHGQQSAVAASLPCGFAIGDSETVYLFPDGQGRAPEEWN